MVDLADPSPAPWEAAQVAVASLDAPAEPAGRVSVLADDADTGAVGSVDAELDGSVAEKSAHGVERHLDAVDRPVALDDAVEHVGIDVHHDQCRVGSRVDVEVLASQVHKSVGTALMEGRPHTGLRISAGALGPPLEGRVHDGTLGGGEEAAVAVPVELVVLAPLEAALVVTALGVCASALATGAGHLLDLGCGAPRQLLGEELVEIRCGEARGSRHLVPGQDTGSEALSHQREVSEGAADPDPLACSRPGDVQHGDEPGRHVERPVDPMVLRSIHGDDHVEHLRRGGAGEGGQLLDRVGAGGGGAGLVVRDRHAEPPSGALLDQAGSGRSRRGRLTV